MAIIDELVSFAGKYHSGFALISKDQAMLFFQAFADTTIVYQERGQIFGFAIYIERPDCIVFFCITVKKKLENNWRAVPIFMSAMEKLPKKPVFYITENMQLRILKNA